MKGILNGFKWIITFIKLIYNFFINIIKGVITAFRYLITIVQLAFTTIATLPDWLIGFAIITISICVLYFIIGRNLGKSD